LRIFANFIVHFTED